MINRYERVHSIKDLGLSQSRLLIPGEMRVLPIVDFTGMLLPKGVFLEAKGINRKGLGICEFN